MKFTLVFIIVIMSIGLYGVLAKDNLIKKVIGISIMEGAVFLFLVSYGYRQDGAPPIITGYETRIVDPVPQALTLTAIVIGASTTALMLGIIIKIFNNYKTLETKEIRRLRG